MAKFNDELNKSIEKQKLMESLKERFPDIEISSLRWRDVYVSSVVKDEAEDVEFRASCGCCADAAMYAMPYVEFQGTRVYHITPQYIIGSKYEYGEGIVVDHSWAENMIGFKDTITDKVQQYLCDNEPTLYDDEDGDE